MAVIVSMTTGALLLVLLAETRVHSAVFTYNAALNRPAYQSSVFSNSFGNYSANLANDGNRNTTFTSGGVPTCVASKRETNPWWAVDLGRPTAVYRVDLTNRGDGSWVGLTDVSPLDTPPTLWNYTVCGQYPGAVPAGATVSLYCQDNLPPARYVIVQFPRNDYMNFCELEVLVIDSHPLLDPPHDTTIATATNLPITTTTGSTVTTAEKNTADSSSFAAIIALSVIAVLAIIVAVILLIIVIKQRTDNKQLREELSTQRENDDHGYEQLSTTRT